MPRWPVIPAALPRTKAALEGLSALLADGAVAVSAAVGPDLSAALDAATASHLEAAVQAQVEASLQVLRAEPASAAVQEAGGRFIVAASPRQRELLLKLGADELLAAAVRRHPHARGVQEQVQWALMRLRGRQPLLSVLRDPELGASPEAVRAALWSIAHSGEKLNVDALGAIPWPERRELASLAESALVRFHGHVDLMAHGLRVLGSALKAQVPDAVHADAAAALPRVLGLLQAYPQERLLQKSAARALASLVEGNACAAAALRTQGPAVAALLDRSMAAGPADEVLSCLCCAHYELGGAAGLLEALGREPLGGPRQQRALLQAIGKRAEACDAGALLQLDAVGRISALLGSRAAPAAVAALGRVVEFLLQHASHPWDQDGVANRDAMQVAIERGVDAVVNRLQQEVAAKAPDVHVYAEALEALRNFSRRSSALAQRISACHTLTAAMDLALEKDYFSLQFESLWQLLGAVSFFSGLPRLQALLEKYPEAPVLHEAACGVLVDDAEHQDGADFPGSVMNSAASIAFYATKVLTCLVPQASNAEALAARAVQLQGCVLGAVAPGAVLPVQQDVEPQKDRPVFEEGIKSLLELLRLFPDSSQLASQVCCALVRVTATSSSGVLPILVACGAGEAILAVVKQFSGNEAVMTDAAVALGVLGGVGPVLQLMGAAASSHAVQLAGCRALAEMRRMGLELSGPGEREAARKAVLSAQSSFAAQQHWQLHAQAELALGLLGQPAGAAAAGGV